MTTSKVLIKNVFKSNFYVYIYIAQNYPLNTFSCKFNNLLKCKITKVQL